MPSPRRVAEAPGLRASTPDMNARRRSLTAFRQIRRPLSIRQARTPRRRRPKRQCRRQVRVRCLATAELYRNLGRLGAHVIEVAPRVGPSTENPAVQSRILSFAQVESLLDGKLSIKPSHYRFEF